MDVRLREHDGEYTTLAKILRVHQLQLMPVMDGFEFVLTLRQKKENRSIPIIVITAKDLTDEDHRQFDGGVEYIVDKSAFTQDELLEQLRGLVASAVGLESSTMASEQEGFESVNK
jgi:DNA-binding response OmpR family regulator